MSGEDVGDEVGRGRLRHVAFAEGWDGVIDGGVEVVLGDLELLCDEVRWASE